MLNHDIINLFDRILKDNNDYFWDKPDLEKINKNLLEYTEKYVKLAPRWASLNEAFKKAIQIIEWQQEQIKKLTAEVDDLRNTTKENA